jgi:PHD/YefM family antitoxin component YafN of YafNO toxin-antitoxin module
VEPVAEVVNVGELGSNIASLLERVRGSQQPFLVVEQGQDAVLMVSAASYERYEHERRLLRSLLRGEREIAAGQGYDLDMVLAAADEILGDEPA